MSAVLKPAVVDIVELLEQLPEDTGVRERKWTREEYHRAYDRDVFQPGERLELIQGVIYEKCEKPGPGEDHACMTAQNTRHFACIRATTKEMERAFGSDYEVRAQGPLDVGKTSDPEPDILVVRGSFMDYLARRPVPADVLLLIEISDTTLRYDLSGKAALYAEACITDYWVADVNHRRLYVYRDPQAMPGTRLGFGYGAIVQYEQEESASPLARPEIEIRVSDLLPLERS